MCGARVLAYAGYSTEWRGVGKDPKKVGCNKRIVHDVGRGGVEGGNDDRPRGEGRLRYGRGAKLMSPRSTLNIANLIHIKWLPRPITEALLVMPD